MSLQSVFIKLFLFGLGNKFVSLLADLPCWWKTFVSWLSTPFPESLSSYVLWILPRWWWWWWWLGLLPLLSSHLLPAISLRWHGIVVIIIIIPPSPPPATNKNHLPSDEDDHEPVLAEITGQTHSQGGKEKEKWTKQKNHLSLTFDWTFGTSFTLGRDPPPSPWWWRTTYLGGICWQRHRPVNPGN